MQLIILNFYCYSQAASWYYYRTTPLNYSSIICSEPLLWQCYNASVIALAAACTWARRYFYQLSSRTELQRWVLYRTHHYHPVRIFRRVAIHHQWWMIIKLRIWQFDDSFTILQSDEWQSVMLKLHWKLLLPTIPTLHQQIPPMIVQQPPAAAAVLKGYHSMMRNKRKNKKKCLSQLIQYWDMEQSKNGVDHVVVDHWRNLHGLVIGRGRDGVLIFDVRTVYCIVWCWLICVERDDYFFMYELILDEALPIFNLF